MSAEYLGSPLWQWIVFAAFYATCLVVAVIAGHLHGAAAFRDEVRRAAIRHGLNPDDLLDSDKEA